MKAFVCEMCGSHDLVKQDGFFVCQYCGMKYSSEEAKKLMVEVSGKVKIDTSEELQNLYILARRAKNDKNYKSAEEYYGQILLKQPSDWEANLYSNYFHCLNCKIAEIRSSAVQMSDCQHSLFSLIKENVLDLEERNKAIDEVCSSLFYVSKTLFNGSVNDFNTINYSIRDEYRLELFNNCLSSIEILFTCGNCLEEIFGKTYIKKVVYFWKSGINGLGYLVKNYYFIDKSLVDKISNVYCNKILKYESTYKIPEMKRSGDASLEMAVNVGCSLYDLVSALKRLF